MKKILLPFIILLAISAIFFFPLYFPETKAVITAEFRGGDIVNMHYPYKFFEQSQLRQGIIPLWSRYTGNGFPIFGQSEIGLFNPINTISLLILNIFDAMVVQIVLTFFVMLCSSYYLGKVLKLQTLSSIFLAVTYSFCAYSILSIVHFPHLQAIGLIPLVFAFAYRFYLTHRARYFLLAVAAFIFQLSAGQFQNAYITLLFLFIFFGAAALFAKKKRFVLLGKSFFIIAIGVVFSFLISSVQLISTVLLLIQSPRTSDYFYVSAPLSINPSYLLTFFHPFVFGDPKTGQFPFWSLVHPWDGTLFIGYVPIIFVALFFIVTRKELFKNKIFLLFLVNFVIFFVFAWERNSPLYFLFSIPPFSLFRFNSRYLIIDVLILSIFAGYGFDFILRKWQLRKNTTKYVFACLIVLHILFQFKLMYYWHSFTSTRHFLSPPKSLQYVKDANRIFSYDQVGYINSLYLKQGFLKDPTVYLDILKNTLATDFNLLYNIPSFNNSISGINPRRLEVFYVRLASYLYPDKDKNENIERNFYNITGVDIVTALRKIKSTELKVLTSYPIRPSLYTYVYQVKKPVGLLSFYTSGVLISTLDDLLKNVEESDLKDTALIESDMPKTLVQKLHSKSAEALHNISYERRDNEHLKLRLRTKADGLLVFRETIDIPWRAYIDGKPTPIYKANFLGMGIWLEEGEHTIQFVYTNTYFLIGVGVSVASVAIAFLIFLYLKKKRSL